jgi:hypothetical protein
MIIINRDTDERLKIFKETENCFFRYFKKHTISNHVITCISDDLSTYGHIDNDNGVFWLGIYVLEGFHGKGNGKLMMDYLINYAIKNDIKKINLSVDKNNYKALFLYLKCGFLIKQKMKNNYIMLLKLNVSVGEAIDKLTILEIKTKKITDDAKLKDVYLEYKYLKDELNDLVLKYNFHYKKLLEANEKIWIDQDMFRETTDEKTKEILCMQIIEHNDFRFRIKEQINNLSHSLLKEQKGYKKRKALVWSHMGMGDVISTIGMTRYLSFKYDEVEIMCKPHYLDNAKMIYSDNKNIIPVTKFTTIDGDKYFSGLHKPDGHYPFNDAPFSFYDDVNIKRQYLYEYFHLPDFEESQKLYNNVKDMKYVFVHDEISDNRKLFDIEKYFDKNDILILRVNQNVYEKAHKFYNIAEKFVNKPILFYKHTIENAQHVYVTDSSFLCLCMHLSMKCNICYYYNRYPRKGRWNHLFLEKNGFKSNVQFKEMN